MKQSAETLARTIDDVFSEGSSKRKAKAKELASRMLQEAQKLQREALQVFTSGSIHDCLIQLKAELQNTKLFEDIAALDFSQANALTNLLGRPFRRAARVAKDEL